MSDQEAETVTDAPPKGPVLSGMDDAREASRLRAAACMEEITAALKKHRCSIVPFIGEPEQIGDGPPTRVMISAQYGVIPR